MKRLLLSGGSTHGPCGQFVIGQILINCLAESSR